MAVVEKEEDKEEKNKGNLLLHQHNTSHAHNFLPPFQTQTTNRT